jgi:hypothetical protein
MGRDAPFFDVRPSAASSPRNLQPTLSHRYLDPAVSLALAYTWRGHVSLRTRRRKGATRAGGQIVVKSR